MSLITQLQQQIDQLQAELNLMQQSIQQECSHPKLATVRTYGANTGNYDPSADAYWVDHECKLCGAKWRTDQ